MPVLRSIRERLAHERPLEGIAIAACLHVTAETANLIRALHAGGARVALAAANPLSTQDDVADALRADGIDVRAQRDEDIDSYVANVASILDAAPPQVTLDDGADLITLVHTVRTELLDGMIGATEETATGLLRVRALHEEGRLAIPVMAVNEAHSERAFNDRYGTGQSAIDGILRATNLLFAGLQLVVLGYGWTGRGVAQRARGAGSSVIVCEVDPIRALEARMDGFEVMPAMLAAPRGDVFVTVTGAPGVLRREHFEAMKDGAVLANAGHFDVEIALDVLHELAGDVREVLPLVQQFDLGGKRLNLLARGRVVNLAAAEGHPASVMDLSFAIHALAVEHLVKHADELEPGVHPVPPPIDYEVATLKLAALGVAIDELTEEQRRYLRPLGSLPTR
jgi:adenosylhomocysteinase